MQLKLEVKLSDDEAPMPHARLMVLVMTLATPPWVQLSRLRSELWSTRELSTAVQCPLLTLLRRHLIQTWSHHDCNFSSSIFSRV